MTLATEDQARLDELRLGYVVAGMTKEDAEFQARMDLQQELDAEAEDLAKSIRRAIRFTPKQQEVEELGDDALDVAPNPLSMKDIRLAVIGATDKADLEVRLAALMDRQDKQFAETLSRAMFAADVLGYVHAEDKQEDSDAL